MKTEIVLSPVQQVAFNGLMEGIGVGSVLVLKGGPGAGKTTILKKLHANKGGTLLGARDFLSTLMSRDPGAIEEAFLRMIEDALAAHDLVIVDDLHLVTNVVCSRNYPRRFLLDAALTALFAEAGVMNKTLVFGALDDLPWAIERRAYIWEIDDFEPDDYAAVCRPWLPERVELDFARIHRFAPSLDAYQLKNASVWLLRKEPLDTQGFLDYLSEHQRCAWARPIVVLPVPGGPARSTPRFGLSLSSAASESFSKGRATLASRARITSSTPLRSDHFTGWSA